MKFKLKTLFLLAIIGLSLLPSFGSVTHAQQVGDFVDKVPSITTNSSCPPGTTPQITVTEGTRCQISNVQAYDQWANTNSEGDANRKTVDKSFMSWLYPGNWFPRLEQLLAEVLISIGSLFLGIAALLFDKVLDLTIIKMSSSLRGDAGIGSGINTAWTTLRDIANMAFIFVLVWAAIQTMLELNTGKFKEQVKNIIIIALLINFSLFFSKIVIDAGNIITVGFYNAILAGGNGSLSQIFANLTHIQSFQGQTALDALVTGAKSMQLGILGLITMLVLAIVMVVASVLFLTRYILLIFLLILSPLAFIGYIIPGMSGQFTKWRQALINQTFFAPYFMLMIWVAFKVLEGMNAVKLIDIEGKEFAQLATGHPQTAIGLVLNFLIVIGFIIGALILSKKMAMSTEYFGAIAGGAGTLSLGTVGFASRKTIGAVASRAAKSQRFQRLAANNPKSMGLLYSGTQKAAKGSFDLRGSKFADKASGGTLSVLGKARGEGGFDKIVTERTAKVIDKGKQFTDRQARADYARRTASKVFTRGGSQPNNVRSMFGIMGRSNRIGAATLLDERIKELGSSIGTSRNELNGYLNSMGLAGPGVPGPAPTVAELRPGGIHHAAAAAAIAAGTLSAHEQRRFDDIISLAVNPPGHARAGQANTDSIDWMNDELTRTRTDRTGLGLQNTLRQQF